MATPKVRGVRSLVWRLTLSYSLFATAILVAVGLIFDAAYRDQMMAEAASNVERQLDSLQDMLLELPGSDNLSEQRHWSERGIDREGLFSRILGPGLKPLAVTPAMEAGADAFGECAPAAAEIEVRRWQGPSGAPYVLACRNGYVGAERAEPILMQVALDASDRIDAAERLRWLILAVVGAGSAASSAAGFLTARRGLRPLSSVSALAERTGASDLSLRTEPERWPVELQRLSRSFDGMLDRLQDSFGRLSRFSADVAHELRGPLHRLQSQTEVALSRERSADAYRDALAVNMEEFQRMTELVERLLFLARAENAQISLQRRDVDLSAELERLKDFFGMEAEERGIAIEVAGGSTLGADAALLRRALSNLIANALRYTPRGGRITIRAETSRDEVSISVVDSGPGIDTKHLPNVFDRFFRADSTRSGDTGAAGLGLAIVKSIVGLHGGSVEASNVAGGGACFTIHLPSAHPRT